jgi:hypothetical protein
MKIARQLLIMLLPVALLTACGDQDCIRGEGEVGRRKVEVPAFDAIRVEGPIKVHLMRTEQQHVDIEAQPNILELIETHVHEGVWSIRTRQCTKTKDDVVVHISTPSIVGITIEGSGEVVGADLFEMDELTLNVAGSGELSLDVDARSVTASVQGSGDMKLAGRTNILDLSIQGSGDIDAWDLLCARARAEVVGSGDIKLHVTDELEAVITGSGDIQYKGSPGKLNHNVTGSGSVTGK